MAEKIQNKQSQDVSNLFNAVEEKSVKFEEKRIQDLAQGYQMPYINLQKLAIDPETIKIIPKKEAQEGQIICFFKNKTDLRLALTQPSNIIAQKIINNLKQKYQCFVYLISEACLEHAFSLYPSDSNLSDQPGQKNEEITITEALINNSKNEVESWITLGQTIINKNTEEIVSNLIANSIQTRATDLHLEPKKSEILLRMRIDGIMRDIAKLPTPIYSRLLSRFKLISGLKLNVKTTPQDGRFTVHYDHRELDIRVSTLPTNYGEAITLRLLGLDRDYLLKIENLGIAESELKIVRANLAKSSGMILLTGATGSGKTTTLYAFLSYKKNPAIKIMTLEDPIEYRLEDISQIQINERQGLTFAKALRGVLRQDPDVIMVGEIRDPETAEITVRAATTGHLVFSTLHAGSTPEIITQLSNMGTDAQNLSDILNLLINQKLVRRLCQKCREKFSASSEIVENIKKVIGINYSLPNPLILYRPKGCPACDNLGYKGQIGIFEIMNISREIRHLIADRADADSIYNQALKEGTFTMIQDGLRKVLNGETTLEELKRVS